MKSLFIRIFFLLHGTYLIVQFKACIMATVKVKFRASAVDGGKGTIYYQVIHSKVSRQVCTGYSLSKEEWECCLSGKVSSLCDERRKLYLLEVDNQLKLDYRRFQQIISAFEYWGQTYTADDVIAEFNSSHSGNFLFPFMENLIHNLKELGKIRTSETYASALNSFKRFRKGRDLLLDDMDADVMMAYEAYLRHSGVSINTSSFYMRNLRAVYNRAVEKELTVQRHPFKHVYTGVDKTIKRAVPLKVIRQIKELDFSRNSAMDFARDMFLFSFYTRGMSFVDMAYLRKKDLYGSVLSYRRRKTGQQLFIKWERCMQEIVDKYYIPQSDYLLPIIKPYSHLEERSQYVYAAHNVNRSLKMIGNRLGLSVVLTMYVSRHSWASIAKSMNVPLSIISEGMGHDSEATTRIYLSTLDTAAIDRANSMILKLL